MTKDDMFLDVPPARRLSGRAVVVAMFVFGITATAGLWTYWTLHTAPFRPFQDALAVEFPGSSPRVDGGQRKMHKGTPRILHVVLRVDFDPTLNEDRNEIIFDRVEKMAGRFLDLGQYDEMHLILYHGIPEQDIRERDLVRYLKSTAQH